MRKLYLSFFAIVINSSLPLYSANPVELYLKANELMLHPRHETRKQAVPLLEEILAESENAATVRARLLLGDLYLQDAKPLEAKAVLQGLWVQQETLQDKERVALLILSAKVEKLAGNQARAKRLLQEASAASQPGSELRIEALLVQLEFAWEEEDSPLVAQAVALLLEEAERNPQNLDLNYHAHFSATLLAERAGQCDKADIHVNRAEAAVKQAYGENHSALAQLTRLRIEILRRCGQHKEAKCLAKAWKQQKAKDAMDPARRPVSRTNSVNVNILRSPAKRK
jgi:tetratricopeptide (TPR) repeat protein